jgi:hypothetical protein
MDEPSSKKSKKTVRFSDQAEDYDNADNSVVIQMQRRMIQSKFNCDFISSVLKLIIY